MRKTSKREATASHNGVYRADEIATAFGIPKSVVYLWTVQEHLVSADYPGRSARPSLFLEKSAAAILLIREMLDAGFNKGDVRKFMTANKQAIFANHVKSGEVAVMDKGYVKVVVKLGAIRHEAKQRLEEYINGIQAKPRAESRPVSTHPGIAVEDRPEQVASV